MDGNFTKESRIFVAGHEGLVGSAIVRLLKASGYQNLLLVPKSSVNLLNQSAVHQLFNREKITHVFLAAAKVGGIFANKTYPADFIYENLTISSNVIHAALQFNVEKLLYLGSSCIYPKNAPQPIKEEYLLSGPLEETNEAYAIAKIAGLKMCQHFNKQYGKKFISVMPTNLYGPNDNFDLKTGHVLPALIRRFHEAKINGAKAVSLWGTGEPKREFLHVDDLASALKLLMETYDSSEIINIGCGEDVKISELAKMVAEVVGFKGTLVFDTSMPDGTPRKLLDISKIRKQGWAPRISLKDGITATYEWALRNGVFEDIAPIRPSYTSIQSINR